MLDVREKTCKVKNYQFYHIHSQGLGHYQLRIQPYLQQYYFKAVIFFLSCQSCDFFLYQCEQAHEVSHATDCFSFILCNTTQVCVSALQRKTLKIKYII